MKLLLRLAELLRERAYKLSKGIWLYRLYFIFLWKEKFKKKYEKTSWEHLRMLANEYYGVLTPLDAYHEDDYYVTHSGTADY